MCGQGSGLERLVLKRQQNQDQLRKLHDGVFQMVHWLLPLD
jgi:hypothetical protein